MSRSDRQNIPGALALAEQAIHLLRRYGAQALIEYYSGSLPFVLGLLYFWSDMSRNPYAAWYCAPAAAGMALLFIWMKYWQTRFCRRMVRLLQGIPAEQWPWRRTLAVIARQAALQATGLFLIPVAAILTLPLAWVYAFYQNLSILEDPDTGGAQALVSEAMRQSARWPAQNHLFLTLISLFALMVLANLAMMVMTVPFLLNSLLGIETIFTISGMHLLNTTYLAILFALTYLCTDPIIKTVYVLRCFQGLSRQTGEDIKAGLKPFLNIAAMVLLVLCGVMSGDLSAQTRNDQPPGFERKNSSDAAQQLDEAIDTVLKQRRFAWRLEREAIAEQPDRPNWVSALFDWIGEAVDSTWQPIKRWLKAVWEWIEDLFPAPDKSVRTESTDRRPWIKWSFILIGGGLALFLIVWIWRQWLRRQAGPAPAGKNGFQHAPDLEDENITADELPADEWLTLARELLAGHSLQQALRALYFSVLALLADHERLVIARHKSNQEYYFELGRRAHAEPDLPPLFHHCMQRFERAWYGMHPVSETQWHEFMAYRQRIADLVARAG